MPNNKWKSHLLKSGLPLEYTIKDLLDAKGCISSYEYSYLRSDENMNVKEFSYDIDSSYIKPPHFFDLMCECKYRDQSTDWIFIPEEYGGMDEIMSYSFLNPIDEFNSKNKFWRKDIGEIGPLCSKGIEINSTGSNPKSITQAIHQLSYAMGSKIVSAIEHQVDEAINFQNVIFYHIPIILTTANLRRLNPNVGIREIENAKDIDEVSTSHDILVVKSEITKELEAYNKNEFSVLMSQYGDQMKTHLNAYSEDLNFVMSNLASNYAPRAILLIKYKNQENCFDPLFDYLDSVVNPSKELIERLNREAMESEQRFRNLFKKRDV